MENNPIKVSIAVPVYNTKAYLQQCLDSLRSQTLKEIEILLIDDGSTDESGKICDNYAEKDHRIKVFHKKNGGLASARQFGLEHSTGEYFICCDSDDWVEPTMYEELYTLITSGEYDMVMSDYYCNYPNGEETIVSCKPKDYSQYSLIKQFLTRDISPACWNKMWKRKFYSEHHLSWEAGINQGEDALILLKQLQHPVKIAYLPKPMYHYRRDLASSSYTNNLTLQTFKQLEFIHNWKIQNFLSDIFGKELFKSTIDLAFAGIRSKDMPPSYYKDFCLKHLPLKRLLKYPSFSPKFLLVFLSRYSLASANYIYKKIYPYFYR